MDGWKEGGTNGGLIEEDERREREVRLWDRVDVGGCAEAGVDADHRCGLWS